MPRRKRFLSEVSEGIVPTTWWSSELCGDNQAAKREIRLLFPDEEDIFQTPKPLKLLTRILEIGTDKESVVLDSFAGSGTTGHAVLSLNKQDGGSRKFILVEMDETVSRNTAAKRLSKAVNGYTPGGNRGATPIEGLGGGFRYCALGDSLFDESGHVCKTVSFADVARHVFFTETGEPLPDATNRRRSPLIGVCNDTAYYLLFNGILGDKSLDGGNVLTGAILARLPKHDGPGVVFGEGCRLSRARLKRERIKFKQIPYEIKVS